jgi:hypothetical protein
VSDVAEKNIAMTCTSTTARMDGFSFEGWGEGDVLCICFRCRREWERTESEELREIVYVLAHEVRNQNCIDDEKGKCINDARSHHPLKWRIGCVRCVCYLFHRCLAFWAPLMMFHGLVDTVAKRKKKGAKPECEVSQIPNTKQGYTYHVV